MTMEDAEKESELEKPVVAEGEGDEDEDTEGMDMKARALTKLLQTSSVSFIDTLYKEFFSLIDVCRSSWPSCRIR